MPLPLHAGTEGLSLVEVTLVTSMAAGAVAGAASGWLCKRSVGLSLIAFMMGIMGGLSIGTGMGHLLYVAANGTVCYVSISMGCLLQVILASLVGAIPSSLVISALITFLTLRHMHPRPPRIRTGLMAMFCGVIGGLLIGLFAMLV
jgi:hypothetical protein